MTHSQKKFEEPVPLDVSQRQFDSAELGTIAHLYRGEVFRSTSWRMRLDMTTNWAIVTTGIAFSLCYADPEAPALPLLLVSILVFMFLIAESRRYRYFDVWRARARWIEREYYAPLLFNTRRPDPGEWQYALGRDYVYPEFHIGTWHAIARRLRRNYIWIFGFQLFTYAGKIMIHPTVVEDFPQAMQRMAVGSVGGEIIFAVGTVVYSILIALAIWGKRKDTERAKEEYSPSATKSVVK